MYSLSNLNKEEWRRRSYPTINCPTMRHYHKNCVALVQNQADIKWNRIEHSETKCVYFILKTNGKRTYCLVDGIEKTCSPYRRK